MITILCLKNEPINDILGQPLNMKVVVLGSIPTKENIFSHTMLSQKVETVCFDTEFSLFSLL